MALYERVPQCDFAHLSPARLCVDGDDYFYWSAYDFFVDAEGVPAEHANHIWSQMPSEQTKPFLLLEARDRDRAHRERLRMLQAIVSSPYHETFVARHDANVCFGVAWNIGAYYVYLADREGMWIFGDAAGVVDILMSRQSPAGPMTELVLRRSIRHLFLMGELLYHYSPCPPTVEPKASVVA